MKEYNYDEIRQMQEKALERVKDMQLKTHRLINGENEKPQEQKNYRENFYNAVKSASKADYIKMPVEYPEEISDYESFEKYFGAGDGENEENNIRQTGAESYEERDTAQEAKADNPVPAESPNKSEINRNVLQTDADIANAKPLGVADEPDKALLLALILLLQADSADEELLMSLLYIML